MEMEADDSQGRWVLDLEEPSPDGFFRVRNLPGEINREAIINRGKRFQVIADLVEVVHGTLTPARPEPAGSSESTDEDEDSETSGEPGALIVIDFQLVPKPGRRFSGAHLTVVFTSNEPSDVTVSVVKMAPHKSWALRPTTRDDTSSWKLSPTVAASAVSISLGEVGKSHAQTKMFHTSIDGTMRFETRESGGKDAARWVLGENKAQATGVARSLRVAVVVRLERAISDDSDCSKNRLTITDMRGVRFGATVDVKAMVPFWSPGWAKEKLQWLIKKMPIDDPVVFQYGRNRKSGQLGVPVDKNNLLGVDLDGIINMSLQESFEGLIEARWSGETS